LKILTLLFKRSALARILVALALATPCLAQRPPDLVVEDGTRWQVIEAVLRAIENDYVFPDVAARLSREVRARLAGGRYDGLTSAFDLVDALDADLQEISGDPHLYMGYSHEPEIMEEPHPETAGERADALEAARSGAFGFARVERLEANIGYVDLRRLVRPEFAAPSAAAAMTLLAGTEALIFDLRRCRGGTPEMVAMMTSYFLDPEPVHLVTLSFRTEARPRQFWSLSHVDGPRYLERPVRVLTSARTFSACEALAENLQRLAGADVIGEATRGGLNPGRFVVVHPHFAVFVPMGTAVDATGNPVRRGPVEPDVAAPAGEALERALETVRGAMGSGRP
jgi:hypothetical protein